MRFTELIEKKTAGLPLSTEEIRFWIDGYVKGEIPDYQVSALLMAIVFRSMDERETLDLTMCMAESGDMMDLSGIAGIKADKHSTGGVGDKTSLVLGPMTAACGAKIAKMSGRGLGFTGGTIDKLESISGFQTGLTYEQFIRQVNETGIAIAGQTGNLVPADKKLYALRDVTGTVSSLPLIASSIMSKKLAAGSDVIVLDVKYGSGAFMKDPDQAARLARAMIRIGEGAGRRVRAVISSMETPLGLAIGNAIEVREAIDALKGTGPADLMELCLCLGSLILTECGIAPTPEAAAQMLQESIDRGTALDKFREMVRAQGGDVRQIDDPSLLPGSRLQTPVLARQSGYVQDIQALTLGRLAMETGAGREKKEDTIQSGAGILLKVRPGSRVSRGDVLATALHDDPLPSQWISECQNAFSFSDQKPDPAPLIREVL